ncbi:hypothetical protein SAMN04488510_11249 [Fervidobacterium changbaicum]|uniref:ACT domain-containing protein n=1 Tax=Fervidobacterium changbaicum TaxID=310769 RepID=A0ABX5QUB0_9BACT|nr:hypothetical protein [Fervidobacterium changbaicum]QAV32292.1 hypothetical protein CBS1_00075 [Fervidobacterium changbaicum]QAV34056.1 hypothetical protein CBS1_10360 [Fervidobacterium changbaicum]SDH38829.1 hypothetical protein SAMN04488510_11249 [Fervidobacterium changbaicum]
MELEKLLVSVINEMTYYLLKNGAHIISSEIVALEKNFYIVIEAHMSVTEDMMIELKKLSKIKDHSELKYYSSLATHVGNLQDIYAIAPYLKKLEVSNDENVIKIEIYVDR